MRRLTPALSSASALLGIASLVSACDSFDDWDCDEREAARVVTHYVPEGEVEPDCAEICDPDRSYGGVLVACALLGDDMLSGDEPEVVADSPAGSQM